MGCCGNLVGDRSKAAHITDYTIPRTMPRQTCSGSIILPKAAKQNESWPYFTGVVISHRHLIELDLSASLQCIFPSMWLW